MKRKDALDKEEGTSNACNQHPETCSNPNCTIH